MQSHTLLDKIADRTTDGVVDLRREDATLWGRRRGNVDHHGRTHLHEREWKKRMCWEKICRAFNSLA